MNKIFNSASKLSFLSLTFTIVFIVGYVVFKNVSDKDVITAVMAIGSSSISAAFGYYFGKNGNTPIDTTTIK